MNSLLPVCNSYNNSIVTTLRSALPPAFSNTAAALEDAGVELSHLRFPLLIDTHLSSAEKSSVMDGFSHSQPLLLWIQLESFVGLAVKEGDLCLIL